MLYSPSRSALPPPLLPVNYSVSSAFRTQKMLRRTESAGSLALDRSLPITVRQQMGLLNGELRTAHSQMRLLDNLNKSRAREISSLKRSVSEASISPAGSPALRKSDLDDAKRDKMLARINKWHESGAVLSPARGLRSRQMRSPGTDDESSRPRHRPPLASASGPRSLSTALAAAAPSSPMQHVAVLPPIGAPKAMTAASPQKARPRDKVIVKQTSDAMNSRFSDMFKAFQFLDLDRSGYIGEEELSRALELWNLPIEADKMRDLIASCDVDGDGQISYQEFVDALARDTVAPAALNKRGLQAMEAMGAADVDPTFLGHGPKIKHAYAKPKPKSAAPPPPAAESEEEYMRKVMARANNTPGPAAIALTRSMAMAPVEDSSFDKELETAHDMIRNKIDTKFGSLRKAFRAIDEDGTGKVGKGEMMRLLMILNLNTQIREEVVAAICEIVDADGDGVEYDEFAAMMMSDDIKPLAKKNRKARAAPPPPPPPPPPPVMAKASQPRGARQKSSLVKQTSDSLNSRYSDMFKAFQYIDLDRSGFVGEEELSRALEMWNLPIDEATMRQLVAECDTNGDGQISYEEFVDALARDTCAPAAMNKRGLQAMEAMGTADVDPTFLGHGPKIKHAYAMRK